MFPPCGETLDQNGDLVQTIAAVVQVSSFMNMKCGRRNSFRVSSRHRICRIPSKYRDVYPTSFVFRDGGGEVLNNIVQNV